MSPPAGLITKTLAGGRRYGTLGVVVPVTWNPADTTPGTIFSNGNLTFIGGAGGNASHMARATLGRSSGKYYFEVPFIDRFTAIAGVSQGPSLTYPGIDATGWGYYANWDNVNGARVHSGVGVIYGAMAPDNSTIGVAVDLTAGTITFLVNNVSRGIAYGNVAGTVYPSATTNDFFTISGRFSAAQQIYAPPAGFLPWQS